MDVQLRGGATHYEQKEDRMNPNVLRHRLERAQQDLDAMNAPEVVEQASIVAWAYTSGVRDALRGVLADIPEEQP
jgi:hypothetical protein